MNKRLKNQVLVSVLSLTVLAGAANIPATYAKTVKHGGTIQAKGPATLNAPRLMETKHTQSLVQGVNYTHLEIGQASKQDYYTVKVDFYSNKSEAKATVKKLKAKGYPVKMREIKNPNAHLSDIHDKIIGYVIQSGHYQTNQEADNAAEKLKADGFPNAGTTYSAFDGTTKATGPWDIRILKINPKTFKGQIKPTLANNTVSGKETVSKMATDHHAIAGVNGGYFVVGKNDGTPGDLAGISVQNGKLISESVGNRSSLIFTKHGAEIANTQTKLSVTAGDGQQLTIDGLNRKPGLIRSCGGTGDQPVNTPEQDVTCTDSSEIIEFSSVFGSKTPSGKGYEVILNKNNEVIKTQNQRGESIPANDHVLSATGSKADWMKQHIHTGDSIQIHQELYKNGKPDNITKDMSIVNGGPHLLTNGKINIDAKAEGFDWSNNFLYNFGLYRQPRTLVGIKKDGTILLVTVDGRSPDKSIGVSFLESAKLMKSLGAVQAMNLDGGGSSTMVVNNKVMNHPSDTTGERPVGDGILITSHHQ